jgi:hypothetical protein
MPQATLDALARGSEPAPEAEAEAEVEVEQAAPPPKPPPEAVQSVFAVIRHMDPHHGQGDAAGGHKALSQAEQGVG